MKRNLLVILMVLIFVAGMFAGGETDSGPKTLTLWCAYSQPARIEAMDKAIAIYEQENPGIKVVRELVPWANIRQKWIAAKMAGTLPQMFVGGDGDLINIWKAGDLEPVDDIIAAMGGPGAFLDGPRNGLFMDGKQIALPHYTLSWKMVVRKDWLNELGLPVPKTWDQFAAAATAMTRPPERYGFDLPLSKSALKSKEWLAYFMHTNQGAEFFNKDGKANFYTPQTVETVQFLVDVYKKTGRQAAINYSEDDCINNFAKGNVGFIFCAGSLVQAILNTNPDLIGKIEVIDTPIKNKAPIDGAGLVGIGKFKAAKYSKESSDFLKFLLRQDIYREFLWSMPNQIPITTEGSKDPKYWEFPLLTKYRNLYERWVQGAMTGCRIGMEYGPTPVASAGIPGSEMEDMFQSIIVDGVSVDRAVKATHDKIEANLKAAGY